MYNSYIAIKNIPQVDLNISQVNINVWLQVKLCFHNKQTEDKLYKKNWRLLFTINHMHGIAFSLHFPFFCACQTVTDAVVFSVVSAHRLIQTQLMIKYRQCIIHNFLPMCRQNVSFFSRSLEFSNLLSRWTEQTCFSQSIFWR